MRKPALIQLQDVLADLYPTNEDAARLAKSAGLRPALIAFSPRPINTWFSVVHEAHNQDRIAGLVNLALDEYPRHRALELARDGLLTAVRGPDLHWHPTLQAEKIIGSNDLLPISFLALGLARAEGVVRVVLSSGVTGTGFVVPGNVLLTNNHVLPDAERAADAAVQFNYQGNAAGQDEPIAHADLDPGAGFHTCPDDDWTAVRIAGPAGSWNQVPLTSGTPEIGDDVYIIQHPGGGPKQVALHNNTVTFVGEGRIQYLTDTMPGSSGAPVFNRGWNLVAIHHSGGWLREPGSKQVVYRNEGVLMSAILPRLSALGFVLA